MDKKHPCHYSCKVTDCLVQCESIRSGILCFLKLSSTQSCDDNVVKALACLKCPDDMQLKRAFLQRDEEYLDSSGCSFFMLFACVCLVIDTV